MHTELDHDICMAKHAGNIQSMEANEKSSRSREAQRAEVLTLISEHPSGLSMKEVALIMGVQFNTVSGRGSELKKLGLAETTGEVRSGSAVLRATSNE